jgi:hypothetical protein
MRAKVCVLMVWSVLGCFFSSPALALVVPFEESFSVDDSNWMNSAFGNPTYVATGGSDGDGFIRTTFAFSSSSSTTPVLFRGHDEENASGNAFVGNWIDGRITKVRAKVRHNIPQPVNFFGRFANPAFFPGAIAVDFVPVFPNVWTEIEFGIYRTNPQFVSFEGTNYGTVFSDIGKVQFGVSEPAAFANSPAVFTYDLDQVFVVPEPASLTMVFGLAVGGLLQRGFRWAQLRNIG